MPFDDHSSADAESNLNEEETKSSVKELVEPNPDSEKCGSSKRSKPEDEKSNGDEERNPLPTESEHKDGYLDYSMETVEAKENADLNPLLSVEETSSISSPKPRPTVKWRNFSSRGNPFTRHNRRSTPRQLELKEEELLIVRIKTPQNYGDGERDVKIPKEEAVCKICFNIFTDDNVLKIKCGCKFTLLHENCRILSNTKCEVCEQETEYIPVMLTRANNEKLSSAAKRSSNRMGCLGGKS